jgi:hypothetical protein
MMLIPWETWHSIDGPAVIRVLGLSENGRAHRVVSYRNLRYLRLSPWKPVNSVSIDATGQ